MHNPSAYSTENQEFRYVFIKNKRVGTERVERVKASHDEQALVDKLIHGYKAKLTKAFPQLHLQYVAAMLFWDNDEHVARFATKINGKKFSVEAHDHHWQAAIESAMTLLENHVEKHGKDFLDGCHIPVEITGVHIDITPSLRSHIEGEIAKYNNYYRKDLKHAQNTNAHVWIHCNPGQVENDARNEVRIRMKINGVDFNIHKHSSDMHTAIDSAFRTLALAFHRHNEKKTDYMGTFYRDMSHVSPLADHRGKSDKVSHMHLTKGEVDAINQAIEEENSKKLDDAYPKIVAYEELMPAGFFTKYTEQEALDHIHTTGEPIFIFLAEEDRKIKMIKNLGNNQYSLISFLA